MALVYYPCREIGFDILKHPRPYMCDMVPSYAGHIL